MFEFYTVVVLGERIAVRRINDFRSGINDFKYPLRGTYASLRFAISTDQFLQG